ncbi:hypothetical protein EIP91_001149 [Steccherinum ochraceum]|uniref:Uncharacterized protein n=1 Tax=Steccherinum ochraceum TaxID=92696 RepID=A0A4R0RHI9_9APHY|nr:hypothetical protein EIP91_001149 [Steccherinum ochraceum]
MRRGILRKTSSFSSDSSSEYLTASSNSTEDNVISTLTDESRKNTKRVTFAYTDTVIEFYPPSSELPDKPPRQQQASCINFDANDLEERLLHYTGNDCEKAFNALALFEVMVEAKNRKRNRAASLPLEQIPVSIPSHSFTEASRRAQSGSDIDTGLAPLVVSLTPPHASNSLSFQSTVNLSPEISPDTHGKRMSRTQGPEVNGDATKQITNYHGVSFLSLSDSDSDENTPVMPSPISRSRRRALKFKNAQTMRKAASHVPFPESSGLATESNDTPRTSSPSTNKPHLSGIPAPLSPSRMANAMSAAQSLEAEQEAMRILKFGPVRRGRKTPYAKVADQSKLGRFD